MKFIKLIMVLMPALTLTTLNSCGQKKPETPKTYFVTFLNDDDSVLYHTKVKEGEKVEYKGETPTKERTDYYHYTFINRSESLDNPIYSNTIFRPVFEEEANMCEVKFLNYDDTVLYTCDVPYGDFVEYEGPTPTRISEDKHLEYTFEDWDKSLYTTKIVKDTVFTAKFSVKTYAFAEFYNYDDALLRTEKVEVGSSVYYRGDDPQRPYDGEGNKVYKFKGRDKPLNEVIYEDTKYRAQFDLYNFYIVTFQNYDGTTLEVDHVIEGENAVYNGNEPSKPGYTSYNKYYYYTFVGWNGSLDNITSDVVLTAQFVENVQVQKTEKEKIIDFLKNYGSGEYNNVSTSSETTLGYKNDYFYIGHVHYQDGMQCIFAANFRYQATSTTATYQITYHGQLAFKMTVTLRVSNHYFSRLDDPYISYNVLPSDTAEAVAALSIMAAQSAVDNATDYLKMNGLGYIW